MYVPDEIWDDISPTGDGRGHLCAHCIVARLTERGHRDVPVRVSAAPFWDGSVVR